MRFQLPKYMLESTPVNFLIAILISGMIWFVPYLMDFSMVNDMKFVHFCIFGNYKLFEIHGFTACVIQFVFVNVILLYIMNVCARLQITHVRNIMPYFISMLLAATMFSLHYFNHNSIAFLFFVLALSNVMSIYRSSSPLSTAFNITFLLSIAVIFQPLYLFLYVLFIVGLVIFRCLSFRMLMSGVVGVLVPCVIGVSIMYLLDVDVSFFIDKIRWFDFSSFLSVKSNMYFGIALLLIYIIVSISHMANGYSYTLSMRLNLAFNVWSFFISVFLFVLLAEFYEDVLFIPYFFMIVNLGSYFSMHNNRMSTILFVALIILSISHGFVYSFNV